MKKLILLLPILAVGFFLFTGQDVPSDKWDQDPSMTRLIPGNEGYPTLPDKPVNFMFSTRPVKHNTPIGDFTVNPNFRPYPSTGTNQSEVIIKRHPGNQNIMFASANMTTIGGPLFITEGVYVTTDGGVNWFGSDTLNSTPISGHGGDPGPTIDKNGRFIISHLGYPVSGMYANYSTDNGLTWSSSYTIASGSQDKNFSETDDAPSSSYYGRSYTVWTRFTTALKPIMMSYTTNGAVSWSTAAAINTVSAPYTASQGCDIRVGPNGEVYVTWRDHTSFPFTGLRTGFAKSTDGGVTWTVTDSAYAINGIRTFSFGTYGIRVADFPRIDVDRSGGANNGDIYIVNAEYNLAPAGSDADIVLHKSTDGGSTWSAGIRVNQDPLNNGKLQFFPAIRVDEGGGVNIVYYDNRNTAADSAEVMLARSTDGGSTWAELVVSDHRFRPRAISGLAGGYSGDYIGITSGNGKLWPVWMDNSTGNYQLWTACVGLDPDLYSRDTWNDTGLEPNPDTGPMWVTNDIWVRTERDTFLTHTHQHQNPEYRDSILYPNRPNYVYVKVKNKGSATGTGVLKTYWAKASTGLNWPAKWVNYVVGGQFYADSIHTAAPININLPAGDSTIFEIPWFPPDPSTFSSFGADSAHFCLLSRIETSPTSPYGMTFPEVSSINTNVKKNNNIVWKNITVVDNFTGSTGPLAAGWVMVRNVNEKKPVLTKLRFTVPKKEWAHSAFDKFKIRINLGEKLTSIWKEGGKKGENIDFDGPYIYPKNYKAYISNMKLPPDGAYTIKIEYILSGRPVIKSKYRKQYTFDVMQYTESDFARDVVVGGERFLVRPHKRVISPETGTNDMQTKVSAYPNPFNPVTTISYTIPEEQKVSIRIYDMLGREIATLTDGIQSQGEHFVRLDGSNLASGIYFYRFESKDFIQVRKLILIR